MLIDHNSNWLGKVTQQTNQYNHFPSEYTAGVGRLRSHTLSSSIITISHFVMK